MCPSPGTSRSTVGSSITLFSCLWSVGGSRNTQRIQLGDRANATSKVPEPGPKPTRHPSGVVTLQTLSSSKRSPPNALLCDSHQVSALGVNAIITLVSIHFPFSVSCAEAFHPFPFPAPRVRISPCLNAKSIIDSAQSPPPLSPVCPLRPEAGVRSLTARAHASALKTRLINRLPGWVTEHTNVAPAESPLAVLINTRVHEWVQWNTGAEALVIAHMCKRTKWGHDV